MFGFCCNVGQAGSLRGPVSPVLDLFRRTVQFEGKHFVVIGAKRSGLAAIELLKKQGARVTAMDSEPSDLANVNVVAQKEENLLDADAIVLSPGVPYDLPMLENVRARGIPTIGEVELA